MPNPDRPRLVRTAGRAAWVIRHAGRRVSTGCTDRASAERVLAEFLAGQQREQLPAVGVTGILNRYLAARVAAKAPGAERLRWAHKRLAAHFGAKSPEAIQDEDIHAYTAARQRAGVAPGTIRTEVQALRAALRWAKDKTLIAKAPALPLPPRSQAKERWLSRAEAARLVLGCEAPHIELFVQLCLHTAARKAAILDLTWDRVDLERRTIDYRVPGRPATNKGRARVPINDTLLAIMRQAHDVRLGERVIEWAGERIASVKTGFRAAVGRAGLKDVTPHTLRHTAITWMAQAGVPWWEIAGMAGHTSPTMLETTYGHHHPDHLSKASAALG